MSGDGQAPAALVLDLDGTLVDTAADLCAALNHVLEWTGRTPVTVDEVRHMVGAGAAKLIEQGMAAHGAEPAEGEAMALRPRFLDYYGAHIDAHSVPFPGVRETLVELNARGHKLGICTNKPIALTRRLLGALDLGVSFGAVLGHDSLSVCKPHAGHLLGVIEALGARREATVMVGDSMNDVACARAAGTPVVVVTYGYTPIPPEDLGGDALIEHFAELPAALDRLA